jgi:hypothetical protein
LRPVKKLGEHFELLFFLKYNILLFNPFYLMVFFLSKGIENLKRRWRKTTSTINAHKFSKSFNS